MRFDLLTIFPEFFAGPFDFGMIRRAKLQQQIEINIHDLRSFTTDKHHIVDDRPFGGDDGMVLKPEPIFRAVKSLQLEATAKTDSSCSAFATRSGFLPS